MAMGWSANVSLLRQDTVFTLLRATGIGGSWYEALLSGVVVLIVCALLIWFLGTRIGLSIRATGDNRDMVRASSVNPAQTVTIGLCIANAFTALSGAMVGQLQKTADINGGTGVVVIGLACLIIGETVIGRGSAARGVIAAIIGSLLYRLLYAVVLKYQIVPIEGLKLLTAVIVGLAIAMPTIKASLAFRRRMAAQGKENRHA